jgi:drug/metabolite transporter (DMT)-like permease
MTSSSSIDSSIDSSSGSSSGSSTLGMIVSLLCYLLVGILWGCTNPFIKRAQNHSNTLPSNKNNSNSGTFGMLRRLFNDPKVYIPYSINQSGSILFYFLLSKEPVSRAAPICNALTFIFTAITGFYILGEKVSRPFLLILGIALVIIGTFVCITC